MIRKLVLLLSLSSMNVSVQANTDYSLPSMLNEEQASALDTTSNEARMQKIKKIALITGATVATIISLYVFDKYAMKPLFGIEPKLSVYIDNIPSASKKQIAAMVTAVKGRCNAYKEYMAGFLPFLGGKKEEKLASENNNTAPKEDNKPTQTVAEVFKPDNNLEQENAVEKKVCEIREVIERKTAETAQTIKANIAQANETLKQTASNGSEKLLSYLATEASEDKKNIIATSNVVHGLTFPDANQVAVVQQPVAEIPAQTPFNEKEFVEAVRVYTEKNTQEEARIKVETVSSPAEQNYEAPTKVDGHPTPEVCAADKEKVAAALNEAAAIVQTIEQSEIVITTPEVAQPVHTAPIEPAPSLEIAPASSIEQELPAVMSEPELPQQTSEIAQESPSLPAQTPVEVATPQDAVEVSEENPA